ncbi:MAG: dihydroorotate dehydrogenase [Candidatus Bipolaricaulota bacterium]|nr:dihydroorotate dehydrogenase [Candidatus Bipolaricaulota bacterium]
MAALTVRALGLEFRNPVVLASGPAGFGLELAESFDLAKVGALTTKTVTLEPRSGNPQPRLVDAPCGVLNSIGLQNPGCDAFRAELLPRIRAFPTKRIVSIAGRSPEELGTLAARLSGEPGVDALEVNLSCPNVRGETVAEDPQSVRAFVHAARSASTVPLLAKLPGEGKYLDLVEAALSAGADGVALINALRGMRIHTETGLPLLDRQAGGLCGPAIFPIALQRVFEARKAFPETVIVGTGGVSDLRGALEMLCAGADLIGVGFAVMADPDAVFRLQGELDEWLTAHGISNVKELRGAAHRGGIHVR